MRRLAILVRTLGGILAVSTLVFAQDDSRRPHSQSGTLFEQLDANADGALTKDEVPDRRQRLFSRLLSGSDQNGDGQLTREEFFAGLQDEFAGGAKTDQKESLNDRAGGATRMAANRSAPAVMSGVAVFRALDADRDGSISASEIEGAAAALKKLDENNDGQLTRDELYAVQRSASGTAAGRGGPDGAALLQRLRELDKDSDGRFTREELPPRLQQRFRALDTNHDGALDRQELRGLGSRVGQGEGIRSPPAESRDGEDRKTEEAAK